MQLRGISLYMHASRKTTFEGPKWNKEIRLAGCSEQQIRRKYLGRPIERAYLWGYHMSKLVGESPRLQAPAEAAQADGEHGTNEKEGENFTPRVACALSCRRASSACQGSVTDVCKKAYIQSIRHGQFLWRPRRETNRKVCTYLVVSVQLVGEGSGGQVENNHKLSLRDPTLQ